MLTPRDRDTEQGEPIHHGDTDLEFRNWAASVARNERVDGVASRNEVSFRFITSSAAVAAPSSPERAAAPRSVMSWRHLRVS